MENKDYVFLIPCVGTGRLTTNHPASSHGQLVFVRDSDGKVYGPKYMIENRTVKEMARMSAQYSGAMEPCWPAELCKIIENWE